MPTETKTQKPADGKEPAASSCELSGGRGTTGLYFPVETSLATVTGTGYRSEAAPLQLSQGNSTARVRRAHARGGRPSSGLALPRPVAGRRAPIRSREPWPGQLRMCAARSSPPTRFEPAPAAARGPLPPRPPWRPLRPAPGPASQDAAQVT